MTSYSYSGKNKWGEGKMGAAHSWKPNKRLKDIKVTHKLLILTTHPMYKEILAM